MGLPILLSAFCCSFGCLFRGMVPAGNMVALYAAHVVLASGAVNFWNNVLAYAALATPRDQRHVVIAGFQAQVSALNLLGTAIYPSADSMLVAGGVEDNLMRYRVHMSVCSLFCVFGFFYMLVRFRPAARTDADAAAKEKEKVEQTVPKFQLCVLLAGLIVQAFGETVVTVLWPLHIRKLGWDSHEYAYLELSSKLLIIVGQMSYPALLRIFGAKTLASALPIIAWFTSAAAFLQPSTSYIGLMQHVINALAFLACCGMMKVCFQHLATLAVPPALQGRTFLLLAMLSSVGGIAGNLFGTRLLEHESLFTAKGATPFLMASSLFLIAGCAVAGFVVVPATRVTPLGPEDGAKGAAPKDSVVGSPAS